MAKSLRTKSLLSQIIKFALAAYFFTAFLIFTPYYNYRYVKENGFVKWLLLGEIVPTLQAMVWPYYLTSPPAGPITHLSRAIAFTNKANELANKDELGIATDENKRIAILRYYKKALREAKRARISALNKRFSGLGDHVNDLMRKGLELRINGYKASNSLMLTTAGNLLNAWGDWYNENMAYIPTR